MDDRTTRFYTAVLKNSLKHRRYHTRTDCPTIRSNTKLKERTQETIELMGVAPCERCVGRP